MSSIEMYRKNIIRKKSELQKLSADRSKETSKIAIHNKKITEAKNSISRTKSEATRKAKLNQIKRTEQSLENINKKIASIDKKIVNKSKQLANEERKLNNELKQIDKKKASEEKKRLNDSKRINQELEKQRISQSEMQNKLINLENVPEKITVLFMASNPEGSMPLKLDEEARSIQEMIRKTEYRDSVDFETRWATRPLDILQAINELKPSIIHFSGHGSDTDELVLQGIDGSPKFVAKETIVQIMMSSSDKIKLVFFNTCFSYGQAQEVVKHVDAAIGMNNSIGDHAARIFSSQFYSAIGFGQSLKKSFEQAKVALMLEGIPEENTPELYVKKDLEAENIFIVKPTN